MHWNINFIDEHRIQALNRSPGSNIVRIARDSYNP